MHDIPSPEQRIKGVHWIHGAKMQAPLFLDIKAGSIHLFRMGPNTELNNL